MTSILMFLVIIAVTGILIAYPKIRSYQGDKLGREKYAVLKNNFDPRRIMEELNFIIDEVNEYWEQSEYFREKPAETSVGKVFTFMGMKNQTPEEMSMFKKTKKQLDDYIKKEWNPRIRVLRENSTTYYSNKELRDAYLQFANADKEIQKLTIAGERAQEFNKTLKVAGIEVVAITGLALGAVGAANNFGVKQSIRDNL